MAHGSDGPWAIVRSTAWASRLRIAIACMRHQTRAQVFYENEWRVNMCMLKTKVLVYETVLFFERRRSCLICSFRSMGHEPWPMAHTATNAVATSMVRAPIGGQQRHHAECSNSMGGRRRFSHGPWHGWSCSSPRALGGMQLIASLAELSPDSRRSSNAA